MKGKSRDEPAASSPENWSVLPARLLPRLREESGSDIVTVYLSETGSPFARSGYILLGASGIHDELDVEMHGPLRPESIQLFSVIDQHKPLRSQRQRLLIADVRADPAFSTSAFAKREGVRSLIRLSLRLTGGADGEAVEIREGAEKRRQRGGRRESPTLLEVFLSYRAPLREDELHSRAEATLAALHASKREILRNAIVRQLMNTRASARRYRRLHAIVGQMAEQADPSRVSASALRQAWFAGLRDLAGALIAYSYAESSRTRVRFDFVHVWSEGDVSYRSAIVHPPRQAAGYLDADARHPVISHVAEMRTGLVFRDLSSLPQSWKSRLATSQPFGWLLAFPLYAGTRLFGVLTIESVGAPLHRIGLGNIVRLMPEVEIVAKDAVQLDSLGKDRLVRDAQERLSRLAITPRRKAIRLRIERILHALHADRIAYFGVDGDSDEPIEVGYASNAVLEGAEERAGVQTLADAFAARRDARAVGIDGKGPDRVAWYRLGDHAPDRAVVRAIEFGASERRHVCRLADVPVDSAAAVLVLPLFSFQPDAEGEKGQRIHALTVVTWKKEGASPTPVDVLNAASLLRTLAAILYFSERVAQTTSFYAWAVAGIGPLHQLQHVLKECREDVDHADDPIRREMAKRRLRVFEEQLYVLHQFAKHGRPLSEEQEATPLDAAIRGAVENALLLSGETAQIAIDVSPACRGLRIHPAKGLPVSAILTCAISNSLQYGVGLDRVRVDLDDRGRVVIRVENRADRGETEEHLDLARNIVRGVMEGDTLRTFENLAANSHVRGKRGLGTWLAAGITRQMLGGEYRLSYRSAPDDDSQLEVSVDIAFPIGGGV